MSGIDDELAYFKSNEKFVDEWNTLGNLKRVLSESRDRCEKGIKDIESGKLSTELDDTYMTPQRALTSMKGMLSRVERDLFCVVALIKEFGESKLISELKN